METKPELLAPVGSQESLQAAVENGADAVYLGGKSFNARVRADNFTTEQIIAGAQYAHHKGVKVYITVNTLYKNKELEAILEFIEEIYQGQLDGVIVQDLGLANLISHFLPDLELHASTQMTVHNLAGAKYIEQLGFSRVVLARELTLAEIKEINQQTDLQLETFVHGALCICYSGQCLMSSLIGGRSGNRGRCAQPCRLPYTLINRTDNTVVNEQLKQKYLLSPKDINTLEILPDLIESGIQAFKIEGRMKRPEYVALTTQLYRKYIDRYFQERSDYQVEIEDHEKLAQVFNRGGFINGYYHGQENTDLISYQRPKNWGLKIGEVVSYNADANQCTIKLTAELKQGDGIEIWRETGNNPSLQVSEIETVAENKVTIELKASVKPGNPVYKTSDRKLLSDLTASYREETKKIEIYGHFQAKLEEKMALTLWDSQGHYVTATSDFKPEPAKNQPLAEEDFREQLGKLGNSPYQLASLELDAASNLFVPLSKLNQLRRTAVAKLNHQREQQFLTTQRTNTINKQEISLPPAEAEKEAKLAVQLSADLAAAALTEEVDRVYCTDYQLTEAKLTELIDQSQKTNTELFIRLPQISRQADRQAIKEQIARLEASDIDGFLIPQLGAAQLTAKSTKKLAADYPLHNFNSYTAAHWAREGYEGVTLSPELTLKEIRKLARDNKIEKEIIIYGHLPMMITEYCPIEGVTANFQAEQNCSANCQEKQYGLKDRKGMIAPIITAPQNCRTAIYNSQPLYLLDYMTDLKQVNCSWYRLNFTIETREEVTEIITVYRIKLNNPELTTATSRQLTKKMNQQGYTTGHFFRGVK